MKGLFEFALSRAPVGIIVYDRTMSVLMTNRKADLFLRRYDMPEDVTTICSRIVDDVLHPSPVEKFPGEVILSKNMEGSPSRWTFRFEIDRNEARVCVFIIEDTASSKLDLNSIRRQYRLTRRETDVLRRILDGLRNSEIALELGIAEQTVKDYLSSVYSKTSTSNRVTLMRTLFISAPPDRAAP
ncbi:MAG: helix-turn-helix transcriptional regulator [Candidatus Sulfobium sp.]|jgi:DNA-binding CsgD family transcriptional regulator